MDKRGSEIMNTVKFWREVYGVPQLVKTKRYKRRRNADKAVNKWLEAKDNHFANICYAKQ
jgi:hypothetical protein